MHQLALFALAAAVLATDHGPTVWHYATQCFDISVDSHGWQYGGSGPYKSVGDSVLSNWNRICRELIVRSTRSKLSRLRIIRSTSHWSHLDIPI